MSAPENEHQEALKVLNKHYTVLAKRIAEEILEHREDFESPGFGSQADDIIEKHARHIQQLGAVYSILRWKAHRTKPESKLPLGKYDFRCFGCGGVIQSIEESCSICGWTWR
jgi:hypothetical protein